MPDPLSPLPAGPADPDGPVPIRPHDARPTADARRIARWDRIGLGIRLAYGTGRADAIRVWLALGRQLARDRALDEAGMLARTLTLLLRTAEDPALPWAWRHACLDHVARPWARLRTLGRSSGGPGGATADAWQWRIAAAGERLGLPGAVA